MWGLHSGGALLVAAALAGAAGPALGQPADLPIPAATTDHYPAGIHVGKVGGKAYYLDAGGRVLYGMDMRVLLRAGPDPALYCKEECAKTWEPILAPGATPNIAFPQGRPAATAGATPDWTIIAGAQGPQWVYKGWHLVFARRTDGRSDRYDGADGHIWNTLKFLPPPPRLVAPAAVQALPVDGGYVLADSSGRRLFTGHCAKDCADWEPWRGGMASAPVGEWRVVQDGDVPQWTRAGQPVFVAAADAPEEIPAGGKALRP